MTSAGCSKGTVSTPPATPPDQVVSKFFQLLSEGGKLTNLEALKMVSTKYSQLSPDDFRKWTENYKNDTSFKAKEVLVPKERNSKGDLVATVKFEVQNPSTFGGTFTTTSQINLILDEKTNEWKIDFMADTINEDQFRSMPAEAKAAN
ncbi:MAG: hypothetical protein HQK85_01105 [Nitrospinae bacterium]|nr:hypothetical protein [Nitrospinota bacterium]